MGIPHIIIVGGGFGGLSVAQGLTRLAKKGQVTVTIINKSNLFLFTPLLHEVASGGLSASSVCEPIREALPSRGFELIQGEVTSVDLSSKMVFVCGRSLSYDYLVLATGSLPTFFGTPGAETYALPLKTIQDAERIRFELLSRFEKTMCRIDSERSSMQPFCINVIGGGPTGVELICELSEWLQTIQQQFQQTSSRTIPTAHLSLIHAGQDMLAQFPPSLRSLSKAKLEKKDLRIFLNTRVAEVTRDHLRLSDNTLLPSDLTIWTAGVVATTPAFEGTQPEMKDHRIVVDDFLQLPLHPEVFVIGDCAAICQSADHTTLVPQLAQTAVAEGEVVARNLQHLLKHEPLQTYTCYIRGLLVSLGQWDAIGEIKGFVLEGKPAWWIWRTIYLFKFHSMRKRFRIAFEWTMNLFYPRDTSEL